MNKKIKLLTSALLLSGSLLSAVPAHAATTTENQTKKVSTEASTTKIYKEVTKPSGEITVKEISHDKPSDGFSGTLWCTGNNVNVRDLKTGEVVTQMDRGDSRYFYWVNDGNGYFQKTDSMGTTREYIVSVKYLSTVKVRA